MKVTRLLAHSCRLMVGLAMLLGFFQVVSFAQGQSRLWERKAESDVSGRGKPATMPHKYLVYGLDKDALKQILNQAPLEFTDAARGQQVILELPAPDGTLQRFRIVESPVIEPELAAKFPEIKTYSGQGIDDPTATARFDLMPGGFHSMILSASGTILVDPYIQGDTENYISYYKKDAVRNNDWMCQFGDADSLDIFKLNNDYLTVPNAPDVTSGTTLRTYRLALAADGEYSTAVCAPNPAAVSCAQAAQVTIMNRVDGVYERDLAVRLTIIGNNNLIVYTNAATDPYTNTDPNALLTQNQTNLDAVIGSANYDIGHVFTTGGGGLAGLGVVCGTRKAQAETGLPNPVGDAYAIDYVAHEMGHQFGGNHTFNASDSNRAASAAYEPGSGITIMAYAGLFGAQDLSNHSIDTFHVRSLEEIIAYKTGGGSVCGTATATGNTPPTVTTPSGFTIPRLTPFALTASATDVNNDSITYDWEEYDLGSASTAAPNTDADGSPRPIFRPYLPTTGGTRFFPSLTYILNNANVPPDSTNGFMTGERLPSIARTMKFQVVARDNRSGGGGINTATATINVDGNSGPFVVTAPNTNVSWTGNTTQTVTWNVAGTTANGINAANVKISLSTDGGQTFPTVLAASTVNDGSEVITVPNTPTTQARIKVEAVGNIFFDINDANFTIVAGTAAPFITPGTISLVSESCGIANNTPDPGETLTVSLPLSNTGNANTTNLTATLQATGGVVSGSTQNYGVVTAGNTVTRNFTFVVNPGQTCGSDVTLTFAIADGATTYSNAARTFSTGATGAILTQNFDGVTAPALPTGWTSVQTSGTGINWVTSTTTPNSAPNAAFANETTTVNAAALVTPAVAINSASAQISFRNRFNLEDSTTPGVGFDGTVLEFSTNNGTSWTDVITGGGSFVSGGYTDTIATGFQSPIPNRMAWSGNSTGYIDTVVNLPASLNGQSVKFRWLTASDSSAIAANGPGQWVDNVQVIGKVCQSCITTAATVSISGRVIVPQSLGLTNTLVTLTDSQSNTRTILTGKLGNFIFNDVSPGEAYIISAASKRYRYAPQVVTPTENITGITFTPQ